MGMNVICPDCGHSQRSSNRRGASTGPCPKCGTQMRAHTAGKAKGRYICPIAGGVFTHGLGGSVQLTEPMRLVFVPGWDDDRYEPDPDRPGWNRRVTYHRDTPRSSEQDELDRAAGRVFGPGCVVSGGYQQPPPGDQWHGRAGVYLVPAPGADPATWFVNEPVTYKKCAACPKRVVASDKTRIDHEWAPTRESYWAGSGWPMRRAEINPGLHPAGTYACPNCRPTDNARAQEPGQAASAPTASPEGPGTHPDTGGPPESEGRVTADGPQDQGDGYHAIHDAVARLAQVCDFAETLDGQGFNATDTWLGHVLAAMPADAWGEDEALAAWDMLRKYRGQLDGLGISYDELPRPPGAAGLEAAQREAAHDRARQRGRQWRQQQYRKVHSYVRCDGAGEKVALAFPYDPAMVDAAKAIKGRSFDWDTKTNTYPFTSLPQIVAFAEAHGIDVAPEIRALVPATTAQAQRDAAGPNVHTDPAGRVVIAAEYNPRLNEALKTLNGGRSTWDRGARLHRPPIHRDPATVLAIAAEHGLIVGDDARAVIEAEQDRQERNRAAATAFEADPVPVPGLAEGLALKPQQYPVVRFATEHRRVLIGDDMGWGKTLSSLAAVAADRAYPAVVVCRPSLTLNWVAEIRRFFPGLAVHEASGTTPQPIPAGTAVIVIGSAALAAKPRPAKTGKQFGWVTALAAAGPKALIIDEGQDTKERAANRSQACEQLAEAVAARDGLVLDLTGTAILNRPRELCQQLTILGRIGEFGGPKAFLWRYCLAEVNEWGASYTGARNLIELHDRLLRWGIMIRRSDDTKLGLPPCREHVLRIPPAELDPAVMNCYRQAEHDLLGYLAERARQEAGRLGTDPAHAAVQAAMRAQAAEHLVAINTLRQLAGHAKRGCVTTWVRQRIAAGEKVMIAAHHRGEVDHYASQFGGLKLQGGQPVAGKEAAKAAFQHQPAAQAPVIAVAIGAGGVGHTLTAAAIGIQAEQAWTPGETQQMKKRLHRIGQDRPVDYYITVAAGTIDEHLWQVVATKQATLDAVLDGQSDYDAADDESSVIAEVAWRLTQQGLTGTPPAKAHQQDGPQNGEARQDNQPTGPGQAIVRRQEVPGSGIVWTWHGTTGFVTHEIRTELPDGATWWTIWAGDIPGRPGLVFSHAKSDEAEAQVESLRATEADKLAANRFLRSLGYTATEHAPTRADCNCDDCQPPPEATASAGPADGAPGQARSREAAAGPGPAAEGRSAGTTAGRALRQAAHFYLGHGLLPVPAWAARADGSCCCPRGADCPRPGKHPRSVHAGPGERDYSWKPLACRTHEEVEQRFAAGGRYADANLMLAIPPGMLVVDQDDDDGGPQAIATLAAQLGDLPPTLAHRTPHGVHRIYHTPEGWTGRAWVGKDAHNPLPTGIDLRVPGQILMAAPSQVPAPGGMAAYGPATAADVAELPAAYLAAWTPPQTQPARPRRPVPVPPDRSAAAARYVHAKVEGIIDDLAAHEPGGRNAAIYHAALKVGSTLGAARSTPGAGHAAGEWTGQAAENALIEAAETNGYVAKHGYAAARSAIRSGLRNGLRDPWPLPDFAAQPTPPSPAGSRARRRELGHENTSLARATPSAQARDASPQAGAAGPENARPVPPADGTVLEEQGNQGGPAAPTAATTPGRGRSTRTRSAGRAPAGQAQEAATRPAGPGPEAVTHGTPAVRSVSAVLRAAGFVASSEALQAVHVPEGYKVQATLEGGIQISHIAIDEPVNGVSPTARTERMLTGYAYALQAAGFHVTSPARETLIVQPGARQAAPGGERARQTRASEAAVAKQADRSRNHAVAHNARQPHQPAGQPNRDRAREPGTDPRASGTRAEPRPPADGEPKQQSRRSGEPTGEGAKDGPVTTPGQVSAPVEDQRQGTGGGHGRHLVTGGDRQAGSTFRSGDLDRTYQLLTGAPAFAPGHPPGADDRGTRTGGDAAAQPRLASPRTEKASCPQCGRTYARPAGETYPCLSCESQARLKAAGFTAGSPEIQRAADWNRAVTRVAGHQPETAERRPESDAEHEAGPHIRTGAGPVPGGVKDLDREREAGG